MTPQSQPPLQPKKGEVMHHNLPLSWMLLGVGATLFGGPAVEAQGGTPIRDAVLGEGGQPTAEISTEQLTHVLSDGSAIVLDARPRREYAISHIPGALNVAPKPGVAPSVYVSDVAEIGRLLHADRTAPIVLYCNGPHCGKSKRLASELLAAGYRNVRRYQLGIPVWRALGGVCEIELEGMRYALAHDQTSVVIDARPATSFVAGSLPRARNIPRDLVLAGKDTGEVRRAKDDGRLPMEDHNTRIIVVGRDGQDARYVAEALAREAFDNVAYFRGSVEEARTALQQHE
jgi:rhodanese-related sulfurtransferase